MMETSIDEGIETEEPDTEDDPPHLLSAYQTARFGQRRHTLSEVSNQPGPSNQGDKTLLQPFYDEKQFFWFAALTLKTKNFIPR